MASSVILPAGPVPETPRKRARREEKKSDELTISPWMTEVWQALGLNVEEEKKKVGVWKDARSKTLTFEYCECEDDCKPAQKTRTISSRQYVLHCPRNSEIVADYEEKIAPILANQPYDEIGFWKAHPWNNQVLVVVDSGKSRRDDKTEITSFVIVALAEILPGQKPLITTDKNAIYEKIKHFLNIVGNVSDPPDIIYPSDKGPRSDVLPLYEKAKKTWEQYFTKNVSVVTKERFQVVTRLNLDTFDKLTRLKHVVEKEDWFKMCMFLCSDPESVERSTGDFREAVDLVEKKVLHFSLMTMVDDYSLDNSVTGVDLIPAFRLWRYSFYQLFIRVSPASVRRFFLCKHHQGDHFMFMYNPCSDRVTAFQIMDNTDVSKVFFYIVPIEGFPCDPIPTFNSLTEVYDELSSMTPGKPVP